MIDVTDCYWLLPDGRIWANIAHDFVDPDDVRYRAWCENGGVAVEVASERALSETLAAAGLGDRAPWPLDRLKATLAAEVDAEAGRERVKYITDIPGQELVYQRKAEEARRMAADPDPQSADYPVLAALVGIEAASLVAMGELVRAREAQWTMIGAAIEAVRSGTKKAIRAASTAEAARAARRAVIWPAPQ